MPKDFDSWISTGTLKSDVGNERSALRKLVGDLRKVGWLYHLTVETATGKVLFSSRDMGCFLPYVLHEKIGRTGRMVYAERIDNGDIYVMAFQDNILDTQFLIKDKDSPKLNLAKLFLKDFLSKTGVFLLEEKLSKEFEDVISESERHEFINATISQLIRSEKYTFKKADLVINPYGNYQKMTVFFLLILTIFGFGAYQWYQAVQAEKAAKNVEKVNPLEGYIQALTKSKPNVKIFLAQLAIDINQLKSVPDWTVMKITANETGAGFEMATDTGTHHSLDTWSKEHGFEMTYAENKVVLLRKYNFIPVLDAPVMAPIDGLVAYIRDALVAWWDDTTIIVDTSVSNQEWVERIATVNFRGWTEYDLDTLGSVLNGKPFSFLKADVINGESGLSGSLSVVVYGGKK